MAATSNKVAYASSSAITITLASLATSSTWVAGRASADIDNSSNLYFDYQIGGKITVGTTPTANTTIEVWVIPIAYDTVYSDVFGSGDANETVTSREILRACGRILCVIDVPVATSNVAYWFQGNISEALGAPAPAKFQIFVVHNTGVNLNATGGNHVIHAKGYYSTSGG